MKKIITLLFIVFALPTYAQTFTVQNLAVLGTTTLDGFTVSLGGNLTTSGANSLTLTTTGATNITLPTTGTLLNTTTAAATYAPLNSPSFTGSLNTTGTISGSSYVGRTSGCAPAGSIGECVISTIACSPGVPLTTSTIINITSVLLSSGEWEIFGNVALNPAATTAITRLQGGIGTSVSSLPTLGSEGYSTIGAAFTTGSTQTIVIAPQVVNPSSSTTYFLNENVNFSVSTAVGCGNIMAIRIG